ncbi:MAG: DJ-1/PfpI family protein [Clostridiales Family XIII bacterium]|jgi:4-methyl-5(b-hydroxyethyl)-thiazole monophosphate biosynthesis|nr:DJ-1/PfpI family protein [Clostridiales Family XIII bacterium]
MEKVMVYVHLADGFEEIEALTVVDVLRRAGVNVRTVSIMKDLTVTGAHGVPVVADALFEDAGYEPCEMLILPGGGPGTKRLLEHEGLKKALLDFAAAGKWIAAICAAPMVLARNGLLDGRNATVYDGMEGELAKARYTKEPVVRDGNFITSRGPGTAIPFALALAEILAGKEAADKVKGDLLC